ncbi:NAD(P)/FAD-dependent oxidoreductase [Natrinema ejinorense]|uniref:Oxidoreductase n=1 Tax=Natrinema ejinorense TaxID=373386 RepID=A0A2A5QRV7_9EURY|nr:FAD-dependent monooxygenase [Natrinema ejinorense]PCR89576.1 oxidoreductase [Natrinema ejinorense]
MVLEAVTRYDDSRVSQKQGRAIVVGSGVAGLCAARVLADRFTEVIVIEQDPLPDEPSTRRGVPQASQPHVLQEAGRATLEDLFPDYGEALLSTGGLLIDAASDLSYYYDGGYLANGPKRIPMYCASRPLFERTLRTRVTAIDEITVRTRTTLIDYLTEDTTRIHGVEVRGQNAEKTELDADLIVDATGRTSRTPNWLKEHGYRPPPVEEIQVDVTYSTVVIDRPTDERHAIIVPPSPPRTRGGAVLPIEDGRWLVTVQGIHGERAPTDPDEVVSFANSLPNDEVAQLLETHEWLGDEVRHYPFPSNVRRRYEALDRFPDGLLVTGDAIASFNPLYGQGMSVAALDALELHHALAAGQRESLSSRFFRRVASVIDTAWTIAIGADLEYPQANDPTPRKAKLLGWYLSRLRQGAQSDGTLTDAFLRVSTMEKDPLSLVRPSVIRRTLF